MMITPIDVPDALPPEMAERRGGNHTHTHGGREARGNKVRGSAAPRVWDPLEMKAVRLAVTAMEEDPGNPTPMLESAGSGAPCISVFNHESVSGNQARAV